MLQTITKVFVVSGLLYSLNSWACSCLWEGPFTQVQNKTDLVVSGKLIASKGNSADLEIDTLIRGIEHKPQVRIWMHTRALCRPKIEEFPVGSEWVMALYRIEQAIPGGFNPNTPNISYGRQGDYSLSICGGYWLQLNEERVSGNLTKGTRWDMNPRMTPVLLDLLIAYIDGNIDIENLIAAGRESNLPRDLILDTKSFLRQQR